MKTLTEGLNRAPDASLSPSPFDGLKGAATISELEQAVKQLQESQESKAERGRTGWGKQVLELDIGGGTRIKLSIDGHWGPDEIERLISFLAFQKGMLMEAAKGENKEFPF
jgi:hypothetical protein